MRERLLELLDGICPADRAAMEDARTRWNSLAKPIGSLGFLEEAVVRAAGITGDARHVAWLLGTELRTSGRALNPSAIPPAIPQLSFNV